MIFIFILFTCQYIESALTQVKELTEKCIIYKIFVWTRLYFNCLYLKCRHLIFNHCYIIILHFFFFLSVRLSDCFLDLAVLFSIYLLVVHLFVWIPTWWLLFLSCKSPPFYGHCVFVVVALFLVKMNYLIFTEMLFFKQCNAIGKISLMRYNSLDANSLFRCKLSRPRRIKKLNKESTPKKSDPPSILPKL